MLRKAKKFSAYKDEEEVKYRFIKSEKYCSGRKVDHVLHTN